MVLLGGVQEQATIQWEKSMWLRKRGWKNCYEHMVMKEILVPMLDRK
jgi:hypothetical protein